MYEAARPVLPKNCDGRENNYKTINYSCIPGSNRKHRARTVRGARIDHPTREDPQLKQDISVEYAADCEVPQVFVPTRSFLPVTGDGRCAGRHRDTGRQWQRRQRDRQARTGIITPVPEPGDALSGMLLCLHRSWRTPWQ